MKNIMKISIGILLFVLVASNVFATGVFDETEINNALNYTGGSPTLNNSVKGIWDLTRTTLQILSVAAVIFAGVRYMVASADQKADIKKGLMWLVIGAVITFTSTTIIGFITSVADQLL